MIKTMKTLKKWYKIATTELWRFGNEILIAIIITLILVLLFL